MGKLNINEQQLKDLIDEYSSDFDEDGEQFEPLITFHPNGVFIHKDLCLFHTIHYFTNFNSLSDEDQELIEEVLEALEQFFKLCSHHPSNQE